MTSDSRPQTTANLHQRRLQTQPSRRQPTVPVEDDDDNDEEEENEESEEHEELAMTTKTKKNTKKNTTTKTKKTKQPLKTKEESRLGITRLNENGELEWFAKTNSEGGKTSLIRIHLHKSNPLQS